MALDGKLAYLLIYFMMPRSSSSPATIRVRSN